MIYTPDAVFVYPNVELTLLALMPAPVVSISIVPPEMIRLPEASTVFTETVSRYFFVAALVPAFIPLWEPVSTLIRSVFTLPLSLKVLSVVDEVLV